MKLVLKAAVSAALLGLAAVASAQTPNPPASFPTDGSIAPSNGNGGLIVQVYDPLTGHSLTEYTGIQFNSFLPSVASGAGGTIDFGTIGGSALWNATFGGDTNPIDFVVMAANQVPGSNASILITGSVAPSSSTLNSAVTGVASGVTTAVAILTSGQQANASQAAGVNPAQTLASTDNGFGAVTKLSGETNIQHAFGVAGGAGVGFYQLTQSSTSPVAHATVTAYGNSNGAATFQLSANGDLTFTIPGGGTTPVPLPAAIWLLGSGLLGFAGIGRRRAAAALA